MKKFVSIIALLLMCAVLLVACVESSGGGSAPDEGNGGAEPTESTSAEDETTGGDVTTEETTDEETTDEETSAETEEETEGELMLPDYVNLGDSIANGYGLKDDPSYADILLEQSSFLSCKSLAVDGQKSSDLLELLRAGTDVWDEAELVTVSTGANNILGPALPALLSLMLSPETGLATLYSEEFDATLRAGIAQLASDLPEIVSILRERAPNADVVLLTVYNPFKGVKIPVTVNGGTTVIDLGAMTETYILELNAVITEAAEETGCVIADVYTAFDESDAQNVNVTVDENGYITTSYDPHPNAEGHRLIAEVILTALNGSGNE